MFLICPTALNGPLVNDQKRLRLHNADPDWQEGFRLVGYSAKLGTDASLVQVQCQNCTPFQKITD